MVNYRRTRDNQSEPVSQNNISNARSRYVAVEGVTFELSSGVPVGGTCGEILKTELVSLVLTNGRDSVIDGNATRRTQERTFNMPGDRSNFLFLSVLALATTGVVVSLVCERPFDPEICKLVRVKCPGYEEVNCTASGGVFFERGGFCNYCHLCAKFVDAGETCNATAAWPAQAGGVAVESVCRAPLICSRQNNGTCVKPEDCQYEETTASTA